MISPTVLEVQANCVFDIHYGLVVGSAVCVAPLESRTRHKKAICVAFNDNGKRIALHVDIIASDTKYIGIPNLIKRDAAELRLKGKSAIKLRYSELIFAKNSP